MTDNENRGDDNVYSIEEERARLARQAADDAKVYTPKKDRNPISLEDFLAQDIPPPKRLLTPWLQEKGIHMVYAPRGQGKTFFAHAVAMAVAGGGRFLRWHSPQASPVLIVDGEMPAALLQHRLIKARDAASRRPPRGNVNLLASDMCEKGLPSLATQEGQNFLLERLNGEKLVIFDNISTLCGGIKENEAEAWHPVSEFALLLRRQGIASLFIHHAGKSGEQRGTSKREDNMDTVISLDPPPDSEEGEGARFCVRFTKARSFWGSEAETFDARMQENGTWETVDAMDARDRQILDLDGEGLSQRDIAREVGCAQSLVSKVLKRAREREHQKAFKGEGIT